MAHRSRSLGAPGNETHRIRIGQLGSGMQKRVGFARAIFDKPDILLLDNPTAGLDPILAARIEKMIETLALESGATVISATGNMAHIADRYHRVVLLHEGIPIFPHWNLESQDK